MLFIISHQGNANGKDRELPFHVHQNGYDKIRQVLARPRVALPCTAGESGAAALENMAAPHTFKHGVTTGLSESIPGNIPKRLESVCPHKIVRASAEAFIVASAVETA